MPDFTIKEGDTAPAYQATLKDARFAAGFLHEAQRVTFSLRHLATGALVVDHADCTIVDLDADIVRYDWQTGDTDLAGYYLGELEVTFFGGATETFPDQGAILLEITPQTDAVAVTSNLCTAEELNALLIGDLTAAEAILATSWLLPAMETDAETYLGHALQAIERTEAGLLLLTGQDFLTLHFTPVRSVRSVTVDGTLWPLGSYQFERTGLRLLGPQSGIPFYTTGLTTSIADIVYTGGFGEPKASRAKLPILKRAARILSKIRDDQLGLESLQVELYQARYLSEGWEKDEEATLARLGRRLAYSALQDPSSFASDAARESWSSPITS